MPLHPTLVCRRRFTSPPVCIVCVRSLSVLGMAEEFKGKIAVNALWPRCVPSPPLLDCVLFT